MTTSTVSPLASSEAGRFARVRSWLAWLRTKTEPHPFLTDFEDRRKARLLANLTFSLAVILSVAFVISVFTSVFFPIPSISLGAAGTMVILIGAGGFWASYSQSITPRYKFGARITIVNTYIFLIGLMVLPQYSAISSSLVLGFAMPVLYASIFLDARGTIRVFIYSIILTIIALIYQQIAIINFSFILGITLAVTLLVVLVAFLREQDLAQVKRLRDLEAQDAVRLRHELELARNIQLSMLPKSLPELPYLELAAYSQPAFEASGDFYDVFMIKTPGSTASTEKIGIVVCDVAGKGVSSALVMSATRAALRSEAENVASPALVLAKVNEMLANSLPSGLFVTLFYGIYEPQTRILSFASAGHPHPYFWSGERISELQSYGMPLGLVSDSTYEDQTAQLTAGDSIYIYTDGLVEALNPQREMYGFETVQNNVAHYARQHPTAKDLIGNTIRDMETFQSGERSHDDVTVVVMRLTEAD